jgi:hypothetical protein
VNQLTIVLIKDEYLKLLRDAIKERAENIDNMDVYINICLNSTVEGEKLMELGSKVVMKDLNID